MFAKVFAYIALLGLASASFIDQQDYHSAKPYKFGYNIKDKHGEQYRQEEGNGGQVVKGSYGFTDERGVKRQVDYVADHVGFRAQVKTNEPGTANQNPAAVRMISEAPYSGNSGINNGEYGLGNTDLGYNNGVYAVVNTDLSYSNRAYTFGNSGSGYSKGAYAVGNTDLGYNNRAYTLGNSGSGYNNGAYTLGNSGSGYNNGAYGLENTGIGYNNRGNGLGILGGLGYTRYGY